MTWTAADIPDQRGRVAVVTGANSGLGRATTRALAAKGALVVMACRDLEKAAMARNAILEELPDATLEIQPLDLASLSSVRDGAEQISSAHDHIDLLVNNAGLMGIPQRETEDGFEMQLGVNHLGHFALTARLLPALRRAPAARVVSVTSFARLMGPAVSAKDPHSRRLYDPWLAYGRSKLANLHFAMELQRRLDATEVGILSVAAHPGLSNTDLQARSVRETSGGLSQRFWHAAARYVGMPAERGALPQLRAATDPSVGGGELYAPLWGTFGPPARRPLTPRGHGRRAGRTLWEVSERETGETFALTRSN